MPNPDPTTLHSDPLSDVTRAERRNLIIASVVGFLVSRVGIIPTRIAILGVEFPPPSQRAFIFVVAALIVYFLLAFIIYGLSDFFAWRARLQDYLEGVQANLFSSTETDQQVYDEMHENIPTGSWVHTKSKHIALVRIVFEFVVPILAGLASLIFLCMR